MKNHIQKGDAITVPAPAGGIASGEGVIVGPGDDAAVLRPGDGRDLVVTTDTFVEVGPVVVRIYVNGPRGSAVVEATAAGEFVKAF